MNTGQVENTQYVPVEVSGIVGEIQQTPLLAEMIVAPNPFENELNIEIQLEQRSAVVLKVYDVTGKEISMLQNGELDQGNYQFNLETGEWKSGVYLLNLTINGEYQATKKLIKQ